MSYPRHPKRDLTLLRETLRRTHGNVARAARVLHVPRQTLFRWIKEDNLGWLVKECRG